MVVPTLVRINMVKLEIKGKSLHLFIDSFIRIIYNNNNNSNDDNIFILKVRIIERKTEELK